MARARTKRGLGPLLKEMRTSPVAAVVNGLLGIGSLLGVGILIVVWVTGKAHLTVILEDDQTFRKVSEQSVLLYLCVGGLFLLGGLGFLLFALVQVTTSMRVFDKGLVWRRFGRKRVVRWEEVSQFGPGDEAAESLRSWRMILHDGELILFHSWLYYRGEFIETMELIAEQIEETHKKYG